MSKVRYCRRWLEESNVLWREEVFDILPILQVFPLPENGEVGHFHHRHTNSERQIWKKQKRKIYTLATVSKLAFIDTLRLMTRPICAFFKHLLRLQQSVPRVLKGHKPAVPGNPHWGRQLPSDSLQQVRSIFFLTWQLRKRLKVLFTNKSSLLTCVVC